MSEGKFVGNVIKIPEALLRFARLDKPQARTDKSGKQKQRLDKATGQMVLDQRFSVTAVLDPTRKIHADVIAAVKEEATRALNHRYGSQDKWPKRNPETGLGGLIYCFGLGNNMQKVYEGFKDMWYIKLSDTVRPLTWNRRHEPVIAGDKQFPYDGSISNVSATLWTYDNESRGVNGNLREVQFVQDGKAYTGGNRGGDDFAALGDDNEAGASGSASVKDPFDE